MDYAEFNKQIIEEFRANEGMVGGPLEGRSMLLLHHVGAKSGIERVSPLVYRAEGDTRVIIASKGGAPTNPDWYHNLVANPTTTVEIGTETVAVTARAAKGAERTLLFDAAAAEMPQFAEYQANTSREIPVIVLEES